VEEDDEDDNDDSTVGGEESLLSSSHKKKCSESKAPLPSPKRKWKKKCSVLQEDCNRKKKRKSRSNKKDSLDTEGTTLNEKGLIEISKIAYDPEKTLDGTYV
jgi:hypothetical protein